jgi:RimJ/RimL family protein N-acetyltransferase
MIENIPVAAGKLLLRRFTEEDAQAKFRLDSDPDIQKHIGQPTTLERSMTLLREAIAYFERHGHGLMAVVVSASGEIVGCAGLLRPDWSEEELGLELLVAIESGSRGKGFATDVAKALIAVGCTRLGVPKIIGRVDPANTRSVKLVAKLGMKKTSERPDPWVGVQHLYTLRCERS